MIEQKNTSRKLNNRTIPLARTARLLSQDELSERAGIPQGRISKLENGAVHFEEADAAILSSALDFPVSFFSMDIEEQATVAEVFHRKRVSTGVKLVKSITASLSIQSHRLASMLDVVDVEPQRVLKSIDPDSVAGDVEGIAREVRRVWGVPPGPIADLTRLVESAGVTVFRVPFDTDQVSGVSQWLSKSLPIVAINSMVSNDRYRWTLAHEVGHLVMHAGTYCIDRDPEEEADRFASEFLTPTHEIEYDLRSSMSLERLAALKGQWGVSMSSLIMKAASTGVVDDREKKRLMMLFSKRGWLKNEPCPLPAEHPSLARQILDAFLGVPGTTFLSACAQLGLGQTDLRFWFQGASGPGLRPV